MIASLPKRLTKAWLERLSDKELVEAYILAHAAFDNWQDYSDARTASNRLDRVEEEMSLRGIPFQYDPDNLVYR
jgi:predicted DNA binding CopG/RHH family protein